MEQNKELTAQQSLDIITEMISKAKRNAGQGGSFQLLLWGWIIALANLGHFALDMMDYSMPFIVWIVVIPGVFISIGREYRLAKTKPVVTHLDKVFGHIWAAVFAGIIISLSFMAKLNFYHAPIILMLSALGMYATGRLLRYNPVVVGSYILFLGSIVSFNLPHTLPDISIRNCNNIRLPGTWLYAEE